MKKEPVPYLGQTDTPVSPAEEGGRRVVIRVVWEVKKLVAPDLRLTDMCDPSGGRRRKACCYMGVWEVKKEPVPDLRLTDTPVSLAEGGGRRVVIRVVWEVKKLVVSDLRLTDTPVTLAAGRLVVIRASGG